MTSVGERIGDGLALVSTVLNGDQAGYNATMLSLLSDINRTVKTPLELACIVVTLVYELAARDYVPPEEWWAQYTLTMACSEDDGR